MIPVVGMAVTGVYDSGAMCRRIFEEVLVVGTRS